MLKLKKNTYLFPLDQHAILLDESKQVIYSLDSISAFSWCCLDDGLPISDLEENFTLELQMSSADASEAVGSVIRLFSDLGLLEHEGADENCYKVLSDHSVTPSAVEPKAVAPAEVEYCCRLGLLGLVFEVAFPSRGLLQSFREVLCQLETDAHDCDARLVVEERDDGFAVLLDGTEVEACDTRDAIIPQVKSALSVAAMNRHGFAACFHAAVVLSGESAVLLPGASGRGKTSLTLMLAAAGYRCLSDENALLEQSFAGVRGVPLPCCVKSDGWSLIAPLFPGISSAPTFRRIDEKMVRYLPIADRDAAEQSWPVRLIIFPEFDEAATPKAVQLERTEALHRLFGSCVAWRQRLTPAFVERLVDWIRGVDCYALSYGPGVDVVHMVTEIMERAECDESEGAFEESMQPETVSFSGITRGSTGK